RSDRILKPSRLTLLPRLTFLALACAAGIAHAQAPSEFANVPPTKAPRAASSSPYEARDPWQRLNRKTHALNRVIDGRILKPTARAYVDRVPRPIRSGVRNLFGNLQQPVVALNLLLQGKPGKAGQATTRFFVNTVFGLGGLFDPATAGKAPYHNADFGQTFAKWGWRDSRYLVLPMFGASTLRDGFGRVINSRTSPINEFAERTHWSAGILYGIHSRAEALPNEAFMEGAQDDYILLRDVYFQRRECQIRDCTQDDLDYELPDYEQMEE
ncbi:MAG TPA: VacJ family lipoprotein, partial [Xanthomonadales bacterium]|nr:VacJ family lipoprotein [Xanthomonadales bacterium]